MEEAMVNEEKVKVMTQLAIYEQREGKQEIKISKYYKHDYMKYHGLNSVIASTFGFLLILLCVVVVKIDYIMEHINDLPYKKIFVTILAAYAIFVFLYYVITLIVAGRKYEKIREHLIAYNRNLKDLQKIYKEEENASTETITILEEKEVKKDDATIDF